MSCQTLVQSTVARQTSINDLSSGNSIIENVENDSNVNHAKTNRWQSFDDLPERRLMVRRIVALTKHNGKINAPESEWEEKTPAIAKRVELSLYSRAASLLEYKDLTTLKRRLQSLITLSYHEASAQAHGTSRKRKFTQNSQVSNKKYTLAATSAVFLPISDDVTRYIYSFLNGVDAIQHCSINNAAAAILPSCVSILKVSSAIIYKGFQQHSSSLLLKYPRLTDLNIYNNESSKNISYKMDILHSGHCEELSISHSNIGERVIVELAGSISMGACKEIRRLCLISLFTNTSHINGFKYLCQSLCQGTCNKIEDLLLGGNSISDSGVADLSEVVNSGFLPKLQRLDLRKSFIGEAGILSLMKALETRNCPSLMYLCMGGNIVTDTSVKAFTNLLASSACKYMRFLGLEDNFVTTEGVKQILHAAATGGMLPKLHRVCHLEKKCNSCSNCLSRN